MAETIIDGVKTELPPEALADMPKPEGVKEPVKAIVPDKEPVKEPETPPAKPEAKVEPEVEPEVKPKKATPFANLLQKKHDLEVALADKETAIAEMQSKIEELSKKPDTLKTDDEIKTLAEEFGVDETFISKVVGLARKGLSPALPKEVQDLIAENQTKKDLAEEEKAFDARVEKLSKLFPNEPIKANRDKLFELAYSGEKAPDGEIYSDKELSEIFFGSIKPEIEPAKPSGETGGVKGGGEHGKVVDFQEIFDRDDPKDIQGMDDKTFAEYGKWMEAKGNKSKAIIQRF